MPPCGGKITQKCPTAGKVEREYLPCAPARCYNPPGYNTDNTGKAGKFRSFFYDNFRMLTTVSMNFQNLYDFAQIFGDILQLISYQKM